MNKFDITTLQSIFQGQGFVLLDTEAKGIDYKYRCKDKDGYLYLRSAHSIQHGGTYNKTKFSHTFSTKNPYFYDNMKIFIEREVNNGTVLLSEKKDIQNIDQSLLFRCGECGGQYRSTWHTFMSNEKKTCGLCFKQRQKNKQIKTNHIDTNKLHQIAQKNGMVLFCGPEVKYEDKISVQDKEGYRGKICARSILRNCSFEKFSKKNPYTLDNIRLFAFKQNWDCVIYNQEYIDDKHPISILCSCGNQFSTTLNSFLNGKCKCNECRVKQSAIALTVEQWLGQNNILYQKEKIFADCCNVKPLPFDFYLPEFNACVEVDGIGHYRPIAFGGDKQQAQLDYQSRINNDKIKTEYCKNNNIPLLRLPFWIIEKKQHEIELQNFILSVKSNDLD